MAGLPTVSPLGKTCRACTYSYMEPDGEALLICGHPDAGPLGKYVREEPLPHCPGFSKWKQHPGRHVDGSLRDLG